MTIGVRFPDDFRQFLEWMNGTDLPTLNVYGSSGEPLRESVGVYAYPRDIKHVRLLMEEVQRTWGNLRITMAEDGFQLSETAKAVPLYAHRYVLCDLDPSSSTVLSIYDSTDAIVYGHSLQEYLEREFLEKPPAINRNLL